LIAAVASILNGIATKFNIPIHRAFGNAHQQFSKPAKKIRATA
jgi:hypothetical protein